MLDNSGQCSSGNTTGITNDFSFTAGACAGETGGMGGASSDLVYRFTPEIAGIYEISLDTSFDAVLYAAVDCAADGLTCLGGDLSARRGGNLPSCVDRTSSLELTGPLL